MGSIQKSGNRSWEVWEKNSAYLELMIARAKELEPEMECAKQMYDILVSKSIVPARVLDVCCSCGHYYHTLKRVNPGVEYIGVDISPTYVRNGQEIFSGNHQVKIVIGDIFNLKFADASFDLVICYNTIQNLPDFKLPLKEVVRVASKYTLIRMLCSEERRLLRETITDEGREETKAHYEYHNTWSFQDVQKWLCSLGHFRVEFIPDRGSQLRQSNGTQIVNGRQFLKGILYEWWNVFITKQERP